MEDKDYSCWYCGEQCIAVWNPTKSVGNTSYYDLPEGWDVAWDHYHFLCPSCFKKENRPL